jgi:GT2 family glycosyltransferase
MVEAQLPDNRERPIELVAVINSFNRRELLERAIASLAAALRNGPLGSAIVVFDAGSSDGSVPFLEKWRTENPADNLVLIELDGARASFSEGVNIGCARALKQFPDTRWLLLYETDNYLARLAPIHEAISLLKSQPQLGAVGFTVRLHDGSFCGYGMRFPSLVSFAVGQNLALRWNLYRPNNSAWQQMDGIRWRSCDIVFTSPLLVRRETWEQMGGFDTESFPFSDSDLDWAWRCAKAGWKMGVIASDDVIHDNLKQSSPDSANRVLDFHRSRLRLLKRHCGKHVALIKPLLFLRHNLEALALARRDNLTAGEKLTKRRQMLRTVWNDYY